MRRHWALSEDDRRRWRTAVWGYLVAALFALGYLLMRSIADASRLDAVLVATGASLPLVVALIGDRLATIKTPWVEVSLSVATLAPAVIPDAEAMSNEAGAADLPRINSSGMPNLATTLLQDAAGAELVRIDLRGGAYWAPSRLYLLAALLRDHTAIARLVYVWRRDEFVGTASPAATCRRLDRSWPGLAQVYAQSAASARLREWPDAPVNDPPPVLRAPELIQRILNHWEAEYRSVMKQREGDDASRIGPEELADRLGRDLSSACIDTDGGPATTLTQYRILTSPDPFVAVLVGGQLAQVVSRDRLAVTIAETALAAHLQSS